MGTVLAGSPASRVGNTQPSLSSPDWSWTPGAFPFCNCGIKIKEARFSSGMWMFWSKGGNTGFLWFPGEAIHMCVPTDPMPRVCLSPAHTASILIWWMRWEGASRLGAGRANLGPAISLHPSPLLFCLWNVALQSCSLYQHGLSTQKQGTLCSLPTASCRDWGLMKQGQMESEVSFGQTGPRNAAVWLGPWSPFSTVAAPDNMFQVFNLKTKKLFSVAWEWRVLTSCIRFFRDGNIWLQ